jgi:protein-tyrosine phosphatase
MIDIHTHILPGVDDGAKDLPSALAMVEEAVHDGITALVATPHVLHKISPEWEVRCLQVFDQLKNEVAQRGWPIELFLGSEIYLQNNLLEYSSSPLFTIGRSQKYVLVELPGIEVHQFTDTMVFNLRIKGYQPILAHPERNASIIGQIDRVADLVERGLLMQMNAGSIVGQFGREVQAFSRNLLKSGLVHFVASDAHDPVTRRPILSEGRAWVYREMGEPAARALFVEHPRQMLAGEKIPVTAYQEVADPPGFWQKMLGKILKI